MKVSFVIASVFALGVAGCATPYQDSGFTGGVTAVVMPGDMYRIAAKLNGYSSREMAEDYVLMKAAETAKENGALGFIVVSSTDASSRGYVSQPGTATSTMGATGSVNTSFAPGYMMAVVKPGTTALIKLVRDPATPKDSYFAADEVIAIVGARIKRR